MGAGYAGKNLSSDKAMHANNLLVAVHEYRSTLPERERDELDSTLFEFKRKLKAAASLSLRRGKDISKSIAQLNDSDLETLRQYINKLGPDGKPIPVSNIENVSSSDVLDAVDEEASVLSYDDGDALEEADTFDMLDVSAQSVVGGLSMSIGGMKVVDLENSMAVAEENAEKRHSPIVSPKQQGQGSSPAKEARESANDSAHLVPDTTPPTKGYSSMLVGLTTSPASPFKPNRKEPHVEQRSSPKYAEKEPVEQRRSPQQHKVTEEKEKQEKSNSARLTDRIAGWRDALPTPKSEAKDTKRADPLDSSYDSDQMPSDLKLESDKKGTHSTQYMGPGELIDAKNETLMGLQRQKVWSYAKNAQLQREVDVLQQQLQQLEALETSMGHTSDTLNRMNGSGRTKAKRITGAPGAPVVHNKNGDGWTGDAPTRRSGPRTIEGNTQTVRRAPRDRDIDTALGVVGSTRDGNIGNSGFAALSSHGEAGQSSLRSEPRRRAPPRRRPAPSAELSQDSDDSQQGSRDNRREAWRGENAVNTANVIGSGRGRGDSLANGHRSDSEAEQERPVPSDHKKGIRPIGNGSGEQVDSVEQRRRVPLQRPRPHLDSRTQESRQPFPQQQQQQQRKINSPNSAMNSSPSQADSSPAVAHIRGPRGGRNSSQAYDFPTSNAPQDSLSSQEYAVRVASGALDKEKSDDDDHSVGSHQDQRRTRGKNVLKNANRRRRHTMDEAAAAGCGSLKKLPEGRIAEGEALGYLDRPSEYQPSALGSNPRQEVNRRVRRQGDGVNASTSIISDESDSREDSKAFEPVEKEKVKPVARQGQVGRRSSAESTQQLKDQRLKQQRLDKASLREERRRVERERQAVEDEQQDALFNGHAWTRILDNGWSEVELLLQRPIDKEEDLMYTVAAAEAGMMFTDQLNSAAKSLGVLRGTLSRWLLPYDSSTRLDEQCSTPHSVIDNMPDEFRGKLTERQVHYLVAGANSVRKLVRIKIADDNDLEQARQALKTAIEFFKRLQETAQQHNMTPFTLLEQRIR